MKNVESLLIILPPELCNIIKLFLDELFKHETHRIKSVIHKKIFNCMDIRSFSSLGMNRPSDYYFICHCCKKEGNKKRKNGL